MNVSRKSVSNDCQRLSDPGPHWAVCGVGKTVRLSSPSRFCVAYAVASTFVSAGTSFHDSRAAPPTRQPRAVSGEMLSADWPYFQTPGHLIRDVENVRQQAVGGDARSCQPVQAEIGSALSKCRLVQCSCCCRTRVVQGTPDLNLEICAVFGGRRVDHKGRLDLHRTIMLFVYVLHD